MPAARRTDDGDTRDSPRGRRGRGDTGGPRSSHDGDRGDEDRQATSGRSAVTARTAAQRAAEHVTALTGREPEGVTSLTRTDEGWRVGIEVVETHRIPDSTDILAEYRVELDGEGELISYRRDQRYYRGRADKE